ncbi:lipid asymmetry maintenance protein MlaB [Erwinia sp. CPCC 100877]|nr:lipid asymmetry maintenance protein MlaB [Erwinia sp. CPCC 100877]
MSASLRWLRQGETLHLEGVLEEETLRPLWDARAEASRGLRHIALQGLERVDTAGLALLVQLVAMATSTGQQVTTGGASPSLRTLARLYNLPPTAFPTDSL